MSEPTEEDPLPTRLCRGLVQGDHPLPRRADLPAERLSRPSPNQDPGRRLSTRINFPVGAAGEKSGDGAGSSSVSKPATAVTRESILSPTNVSQLHTISSPTGPIVTLDGTLQIPPNLPAAADPSDEFKSALDVQVDRVDIRRRFRSTFGQSITKDPYAPSIGNKFTGFLSTAAYATKIFLYKTLIILLHLPEYIVRGKRRLFRPSTPEQRIQRRQRRRQQHNASSIPLPATGEAPEKKSISFFNILEWIFKKSHLKLLGAVFTIACNVGFAAWVWIHVDVYLNPHKWRLRPHITTSQGVWTSFTSVEIWVAIMLGIWNMGGAILIALSVVIIIEGTQKRILNKMFPGKFSPPVTSQTSHKPASVFREFTNMSAASTLFALFVFMILWPILACTIAPPRKRVDTYGSKCSGNDWDYKVILDGRVDPKNLTKGRVQMWDLETNTVAVSFLTANYVNTTWLRTDENVLLVREGDLPTDKEYVSEVAYQFPYIWTDFEDMRWAGLADIPRNRNGNYSASLTDPVAKTSRKITGAFPYLEDQTAGLRLDEIALIPDVKRSWRTTSLSSDNCGWGPDAKLLENIDPAARELVGDGHVVLETSMTRWGRCSELTVCANRRKQVVSGLEYAQGEEGKKLLDEMLIVPLGLLLVEQIRWGSCCGDGFDPYKAK
ncbi:hypothetical protein H072_3770 [Dactylellina haptotyla CBS 200.50]|uniref:Uncharacterized protein n=1 Tax=Dactylellina haptotyla (strain CBS 200.50) TaxID=1284197 RepID=S8C3G8_DACHA|nr:hypothetical protein H072_3770 [Dactylellina haptotyla CBS 200.50]